ncbi:MAG: tyrosine-type recombinase/integrase [Methylocystis sp.]
MPRRQPYPGLKKDVSRHGQVRWYVRHYADGAEKLVRLPDYPGASREAETAYHAAIAQKPIVNVEPGEKRFASGTFGHLCGRYLGSPKFLSLAPITQAGYRRHIDALRREFGQIPYVDFRRRHIVKIIERKADKPGEANNVLKALQVVFTYAVKTDLLDVSPVAGVEKLKVTTDRAGGAEPWTEDHAAMFRARWPIGAPQRTLFEIMWNTTLRIGDALLLGPQHVRDGRLRMVTSKRGVPVDMRVFPELAEALRASPTAHMTYLATQGGRTRSAKAAYSWFSKAASAAGLPPGYTAHGCRKGRLTQAADAGATDQQLVALAGHSSAKSLPAYLKKTNRGRLADGGLAFLGMGSEDRNRTGIVAPCKKVRQKNA